MAHMGTEAERVASSSVFGGDEMYAIGNMMIGVGATIVVISLLALFGAMPAGLCGS